ncbi:hypothetical protein HPB52_020902 [Rhipicephalus sanguineus]|uniref:Uncharacterized protein n=1 Tax=Rhipicephalus sanguineus TaxID=34632 RepID=A0A9D4PPW4_RHISA|nr:hypothetical protein HPB52_020902 [Rhipicephalus sanguineus]
MQPGLDGPVPAPASVLHEHVAFITPVGQTTAPAWFMVRLLKANIGPSRRRSATSRYAIRGLQKILHVPMCVHMGTDEVPARTLGSYVTMEVWQDLEWSGAECSGWSHATAFYG